MNDKALRVHQLIAQKIVLSYIRPENRKFSQQGQKKGTKFKSLLKGLLWILNTFPKYIFCYGQPAWLKYLYNYILIMINNHKPHNVLLNAN